MFPQGEKLLASLNVKVVGSGDRTVVLAHGFGNNQSMWEPVLASLVDMNKVVLFDWPGAGTTNPDDFDFSVFQSYYAFADILLALLEELHVKNCAYIGHSMSGMIGCIAAIKQPQLFEKLILLGASPRYLNDKDYYGGFDQEDLNQLFDAMKADFQGWAAGFAPLVLGVQDTDAITKFTTNLTSMKPDVAFAMAKCIFEDDHRGILPEVKVPSYVLQTTRDMAVPMVVADYMVNNLGDKCSLEVLQTEGHIPTLTAPDVLITSLQKILISEQ